ncbi:MAG: isoaspartyl peptidase/L-asparaginase [Rubrivivax sp.]|nr:isoaspartyl peptidase/L-asparaginase [Rubrivivax sp.]
MPTTHRPVLALHGGCGTPAESELSPADWREVHEHLAQALRRGWAAMARAGGGALDGVEAAVVALEDSPHFNAGFGAALCEDGTHELDASIMDGRTRAAGAVSAVRHLRNPVRAARAVMERSGCVLLTGAAADAFGRAQGLDCVENHHFTTPRRVAALKKLRAVQAVQAAQAADAVPASPFAAAPGRPGPHPGITEADRHGTVGAVALDAAGHLAAATSTGGFNNKPVGRVGDSPVIGAGTYATDGLAAVSCTGQGEVFIRHVVAHDLVAQMRYAGRSLQEASRVMLDETLAPHRVGAGWVALDALGRVVAVFNTLGMARGWVDAAGQVWVGTHRAMLPMGPV